MGSSDLEFPGGQPLVEPPPGQAATPRRLARIVGTAVAGALGVVTLGLVLALWGLGLSGKISQSTSEVLDLVKLGFALVAGVGGTVGLVLAYQRHLIAVEAGTRERAKEAREGAKEAREEAKLFNERFGTAAGQLDSDKYASKLAGVYAMAKLADDWDDGRQTCINVLCANLRRGWTPGPEGDGADPAALLAFADNQEFRHTIIAVIATRLRAADSSWQGCNLDFHGTVFDGGDFGGARFSGGTVDFRGATFCGDSVGFRHATFSGSSVDFRGARFSGGSVDFGGATFSGGAVYFGVATFSGSTVGFSYARFSGGFVSFDGATFSGGRVGFSYATFSGSSVGFSDATFAGGAVAFSGATFSGGAVAFSGARFSGGTVRFGGAIFSGGAVDFSGVSGFAVPPQFGFSPGAVPTGVSLPAGYVPPAAPSVPSVPSVPSDPGPAGA